MENEDLIQTPVVNLSDEQFIEAYKQRSKKSTKESEKLMTLDEVLYICLGLRFINSSRLVRIKTMYKNG